MDIFKALIKEEKDGPIIDSGSCIDCEWEGLLSDCTEYDTDEDFAGNPIQVPVCPKCGGGLDDFFPSKI